MANTISNNSTHFVVTPVIDRLLNVFYLDNNNIVLKLNDYYSQVTPESQLDKEQQKQRDYVYGVYMQRRELLENVGKGLAKLPEDMIRKYEPFNFVEPENTPVGTAYFYSYSFNLRAMKNMLEGALDLTMKPHGGLTQEIGVLQFSVQDVSVKEANAIASTYPDLVIAFQPPVIREGAVRKGAKVSNERKKPVSPVRSTVQKPVVTIKESERPVTSNKDAVTTRKASAKELEMLATIKEQKNQ